MGNFIVGKSSIQKWSWNKENKNPFGSLNISGIKTEEIAG